MPPLHGGPTSGGRSDGESARDQRRHGPTAGRPAPRRAGRRAAAGLRLVVAGALGPRGSATRVGYDVAIKGL